MTKNISINSPTEVSVNDRNGIKQIIKKDNEYFAFLPFFKGFNDGVYFQINEEIFNNIKGIFESDDYYGSNVILTTLGNGKINKDNVYYHQNYEILIQHNETSLFIG